VKSARAEAEKRKDAAMVASIDEYRDLLKRVAKARAIQRELNAIEKSNGLITPWPDPPALPRPRLD
jgi:hypothetical protein